MSRLLLPTERKPVLPNQQQMSVAATHDDQGNVLLIMNGTQMLFPLEAAKQLGCILIGEAALAVQKVASKKPGLVVVGESNGD